MFDYNLNNCHQDIYTCPGAYEWWYFDAELDNGYKIAVTLTAGGFAGAEYGAFITEYAKNPSLKYNASDFANVTLNLTDHKDGSVHMFSQNFRSDDLNIASDRVQGKWGGACSIDTDLTGPLPISTITLELPDAEGGSIKGQMVFQAVVEGSKIGRGANMDADVNGTRLFHKWIVAMPTAKVTSRLTVIDKDGNAADISSCGFGYHDHNWGNHSLMQTLDRWYWGRIAELDMTIIYAKVWNIVPEYPTYSPMLFTQGDRIITSTEKIDILENNVITGEQDLKYATGLTIRFLEGSGVKGEMNISGLKLIGGLNCYLRFAGDYDLDVETDIGKISKKGQTVLEYAAIQEMVKRSVWL